MFGYSEFVDSSVNLGNFPPSLTELDKKLLLGAIGLNGEAGEVIELIKKDLFHSGKPLDHQELVLELGDVMWYLTLMCNALEIPLSDIIDANIDKLEARRGVPRS